VKLYGTRSAKASACAWQNTRTYGTPEYAHRFAADSDAHASDLAVSLLAYAVLLSGVRRHEDALAIAQEAVKLYRELHAASPDEHTPALVRTERPTRAYR
jgi:hypothetical protein